MASPRPLPAASAGTDPAPPGALDGDGVEALVREHERGLRGFLRYLGCPTGEVDDLLQETFLTFLSADFERREPRATARYLRSIGRHLFLKGLRRRERQAPALDMAEAEAVWAGFQEEGGGAPYLEALRRCLEGLGGRARRALELRYAADMGQAAIAARLEMAESGVHSILVRARRRLRECLDRRLGP